LFTILKKNYPPLIIGEFWGWVKIQIHHAMVETNFAPPVLPVAGVRHTAALTAGPGASAGNRGFFDPAWL